MATDDEGSITRWLGGVKQGDEVAAQALWERYFAQMVRLARKKLLSARRANAVADEEDAALSAFDSFCAGAARGRFPDLTDRDGLWRLLVVITSRKVQAQGRIEHRPKAVAGWSRTSRPSPDWATPRRSTSWPISSRLSRHRRKPLWWPRNTSRLLDALGDETLRSVAVWKMEGYSSDEIGERLGCARRTVARQLALIRTIWRNESPVED